MVGGGGWGKFHNFKKKMHKKVLYVKGLGSIFAFFSNLGSESVFPPRSDLDPCFSEIENLSVMLMISRPTTGYQGGGLIQEI